MGTSAVVAPIRRAGPAPRPEACAPSEGGAWRTNLLSALFVAALALPAVAGPGAGALRLAYPAAILMAAAWLVLRDRIAAYAVLVLWTFTLTPLVRRLVDWREGWLDANTVMLAPYAACAVSLVALPTLIAGERPPEGRLRLLAMLAAIAYGLLLALAGGRIVSGVYDALRWGLPICLGTALLLAQRRPLGLRRHVEAYFALALPLCSAYGIWQFVVAPPWDTLWMVRSEMNSIGDPVPYQVRVFATWNSPGSFSFFLLAGIMVMAASRSRLREVALVLGLVALALSLVRSAWLAVPIGLAVVLVLGPGGVRLRLAALLGVAVLALPLLSLDPRVEELLAERVESLTRIGADTSADDRLAAYAALAAELDEQPQGLGLALSGGYADADGAEDRVIDGGFIEVPLALGVVGGGLYLLCAASLGAQGIAAARRRPSLAGHAAVVACFGLLFVSGTTTVGEIGLFLWLSLALLLGEGGEASLARRGASQRFGNPGE